MKISQIANKFQEIEAQKEHTKEILDDVSKHFGFALIAGGAPRNWSFNRLANDFDIYVCRKLWQDTPEEQKEIDKKIEEGVRALSDLFGGFGENRAKREVNSNPYGGFILSHLYDFKAPVEKMDEDIRCGTYTSHQDCQLIVIDDHRNEVKDLKSFSERIFMTYDFGICMTSMDKDGNFYNSDFFKQDKKNKTFTTNIKQLKRNNQAGMEKLVERFEKMEKYFPDHRMRISV